MVKLSKKVAVFFSILIILSMLLLLVEPSCLASVDNVKPAVPSFTLKEISQPYDVPATAVTTVDQYTGEKTTINYPGYTVENKTIYLVVKNQPFTPYKNDKDETMNLYYYYAYRGHYYEGEGGWSSGRFEYYAQSDSEYTFIHFDGVSSSGKIDVKVRALVGTLSLRNPIPGLDSSGDFYFNFKGVEGDWSNTVVVSFNPLTFTTLPPTSTPINTDSVTSNPTDILSSNPSETTAINPPQQSPWATNLLIVIAIVCIITIPITIVMYYNRHQQRKAKTSMVV